jgi:vacuolar protein sorting-associated protein 16
MIGTNPFEDSGPTSNPFDDSVANNEMHVSSHNDHPPPFFRSDSHIVGDDHNDEDEDDTYDNEHGSGSGSRNKNASTVPVEASWQYLGDLPYRRIPVYENVRWGQDIAFSAGDDQQGHRAAPPPPQILNYGLSAFPRAALQRHSQELLTPRELRELLTTSTITKVVGCPHGGPVAAVTLPILGEMTWFSHTEIRIMTNAGRPLCTIDFPQKGSSMERNYTPADILEIGFTHRAVFVVVLRDSLCLTYRMSDGEALLPPFHLLPRGDGQGTELLQATIFDGGAAVLSSTKHVAIVEFLDSQDDPSYFQTAHLTARKILPEKTVLGMTEGASSSSTSPVSFCGLVTHLPTATFASENFYSYAAIAVLSRLRTANKHPEVFLSTTDNSVVVVNVATTDIVDLNCRARIASPIVEMSFAPNGRFLACYTESNMLTVISSTFETKVLDFDTSEGSNQAPLEMKWCGEDSVVLHWKNLGVLMVGPYGDWLRFPYEDTGNLYLIPELDCCRVVTDISVEILQRVPPATALLLRIGSIEPSAMLLDAADAFDSGSAASDEAARAISKTGMLNEAIESCTEAAAREFDIATQKRLLRAASYGMHFFFKDPKGTKNIMGGQLDDAEDEDSATMPSKSTMQFVHTARKLRILNALRNPSVGMVLTSAQYDAITDLGVIARLIALQRPALATSISKYLGLPKSVQLYARASKAAAFVASEKTKSDAETAQAAIDIIHEGSAPEATGGISSSINRGAYATVALAANRAGRPGVANLLLMLESSVADKVPALISTGSYPDAVAVATAARDADFIFHTLMEFQKHCFDGNPDAAKANQTFISSVVTKFTPEGFHTLRRYLGTRPDVKNTIQLQLRAQKFADAGIVTARRALEESKREQQDKSTMLKEASRIFGMGKDTMFHKGCTDDYLELMKDQEVLRTKYGSQQVAPDSSSVIETITSVIYHASRNEREAHRLVVDADKIAKKFKVPEKMLWHTKVNAFSRTEQWNRLQALADSKAKPPIGFKPFARAAIKGKQSNETIARYIERVTVQEERFDLYCEASLWRKALEEAGRLRDERRIIDVKNRCNDPDLQLKADQMLAKLAGS